jgi:hypothetical protein
MKMIRTKGFTNVKFVKKRNSLLYKFFKELYPNNTVIIIGDVNKPLVVIEIEKGVYIRPKGYVKNFTFYFSDAEFNGNILEEQKISHKLTEEEKNLLKAIIEKHNIPLYYIGLKVNNTLLKLSNWRDIEGKKHPSFSTGFPKFYLTKDHVESIYNFLNKEFPSLSKNISIK